MAALTDMGAIVADVRLSPFGTYTDVGSLIARSESYAIHQHWLRTTPELYGAFARHRLMAGAFVTAADYINALRERTRLIAELAEVMQTVDVVIFPTARCPARPIGEDFDGVRLPAVLQPRVQRHRQPGAVDL